MTLPSHSTPKGELAFAKLGLIIDHFVYSRIQAFLLAKLLCLSEVLLLSFGSAVRRALLPFMSPSENDPDRQTRAIKQMI